MKIKNIAAACVALGLSMQSAHAEMPASAGNPEQTIKNLINILVQKKILTQDAADELLNAAAQPAASSQATPVQTAPKVADAPVAPGVVRVPYIPQVVREQIKGEIKDEVLAQAKGERWGDPGSMPDWLSRISFDGDFRVRAQHNGFPSGNTLPSQYNPLGTAPLMSNTTLDHNYLLLAASLGMKAKISDSTFTALRITTGNTANPDSTNQTLGGGNGGYYALNQPAGLGNGNFNKYSLVLEQAYVQSDPYYWLMLSAGKMPNPWLSSDMVWDTDVNFEGLAASLKPRFSEAWSGFMTAGAFPVQDIVRSETSYANSKWLYAAQAGMAWSAPNASTAKLGVALYDFQNVEGTQNSAANTNGYDGTAISTMQKGNSLMYITPPNNGWNNGASIPALLGLASQFKELDITGKFDLATFDPVHVVLTADYVKNIAFDQAAMTQRTGYVYPYAGNIGYQLRLDLGVPRIHERGEWQAYAAYKYIESDAVLDALNDQDFNLGGTNAKGFILGGAYGIDKNTWLSLRWLSTDQISGVPLSIDVLQLDLSTRF